MNRIRAKRRKMYKHVLTMNSCSNPENKVIKMNFQSVCLWETSLIVGKMSSEKIITIGQEQAHRNDRVLNRQIQATKSKFLFGIAIFTWLRLELELHRCSKKRLGPASVKGVDSVQWSLRFVCAVNLIGVSSLHNASWLFLNSFHLS